MHLILIVFLGLQMTDMNHDARISALEENGSSGGCQNGLLSSQGM